MARYVILGTGAAGIAAAEAARGVDPQVEIVCVAAEKAGYYSRPGLAYYLSKELSHRALYPFSNQDFNSRGIRLYQNKAVRIDPDTHTILFQDGKKMRYDRALLALGAQAVRPKIDGADLDGVVYLDSMSQTRLMIRKARWARSAVVIGGGITALEIVEGLQARGVKVHFFLRGEDYWSRVLDKTESIIVLNRLKHEGVAIHLNTELDRIVDKRRKVNAVITRDGRRIKTSMVAFAIGVRPRLGLAQASGLDVRRGVRVNQFMQTSAPNVFAAGDVAEVHDPETDSWVVDSLWPVARHQGSIAGKNMAGEPTPYRRSSPLNVTRLTGVTTTIIGQVGSGEADDDEVSIVRGESETWQKMPDAVVCQNNFDINRLRVMVGDRSLLGAVLMGDQSLSRPLEELVAGKVDITPIREALVAPGADLGGTIFNFWNAWRQTVAA